MPDPRRERDHVSMNGDLYATALTDWLACAAAGAGERAARAARANADDLAGAVAFAATAGHVLDFDDTLPSGLAHISAATAPAALMVAAHLGLPLTARSRPTRRASR